MPEKICEFVPMEQIEKAVKKEFAQIEKEILDKIPNAVIQHVGSSAVEGALTKKDLDITIQVEDKEFERSIAVFKNKFKAIHRDVWRRETKKGMAIFTKKILENPNLETVDIMLVVKGSKFDGYDFQKKLLEKDPCLLQAYNQVKNEYQGKPYNQYRKEKSKFWGGHD